MPTDKRARQKAARQEKLEAQRKAQKRRNNTRRIVVVVLIAAVVITSVALIASSGKSKTTLPTFGNTPLNQSQVDALTSHYNCPASPTTRVNQDSWSSAPPMTINTRSTYYAHILTTQGPVVIKLSASTTPQTVNNFVFLANQKYYNCNVFMRVIPSFMNQTGDPTGSQTGGPGYTIPDELPAKGNPTYPLYSVAMANTGSPHTGGSQFFIVAGSEGESLPNSYSLFGQVISGTKAIDFINQQGTASGTPTVYNRMLTVTITNQS